MCYQPQKNTKPTQPSTANFFTANLAVNRYLHAPPTATLCKHIFNINNINKINTDQMTKPRNPDYWPHESNFSQDSTASTPNTDKPHPLQFTRHPFDTFAPPLREVATTGKRGGGFLQRPTEVVHHCRSHWICLTEFVRWKLLFGCAFVLFTVNTNCVVAGQPSERRVDLPSERLDCVGVFHKLTYFPTPSTHPLHPIYTWPQAKGAELQCSACCWPLSQSTGGKLSWQSTRRSTMLGRKRWCTSFTWSGCLGTQLPDAPHFGCIQDPTSLEANLASTGGDAILLRESNFPVGDCGVKLGEFELSNKNCSGVSEFPPFLFWKDSSYIIAVGTRESFKVSVYGMRCRTRFRCESHPTAGMWLNGSWRRKILIFCATGTDFLESFFLRDDLAQERGQKTPLKWFSCSI